MPDLPSSPTPSLVWRWCRFDDLSVRELDAVYCARQQTFVIEQACAYLDADGCDAQSFHLAARAGTDPTPLAYARIVWPGVKYPEPSIGRVLTLGPGRGIGLGRELLRRAITGCRLAFPGQAIRIAAQAHLTAFYQDAGFQTVGAPYLEDGIAHVEMLRADS